MTAPDPEVAAGRPMARSDDPRAVRTREKLVEAFRSLAETAPPGGITVAALTEAAGIHRSVFYKHFASPDDLAIYQLRDLFTALSDADIVMRNEFAVDGAEASRRAMTDFVRFVAERRSVYVPLLGSRAPAGAVARIVDAFADLTAEAIAQMPQRPEDVDTHTLSCFLAHGVLGVVGRWLDQEPPTLTEQQLVEQLMASFPGWLTGPAPRQ